MSLIIDFHTHIGRYEMYQSWVQDLYDQNLGADARAKLDELLTPRGYAAYLEACGVDYECCLAEIGRAHV